MKINKNRIEKARNHQENCKKWDFKAEIVEKSVENGALNEVEFTLKKP